MNNRFIKKSDFFIIGVIVIISLVFILLLNREKNAEQAKIYKNSDLIATVSLNENAEFTLPEAQGFLFSVKDGKISVTASPCENKICVHSGYISKGGQSIVCLPERLVVALVSEDGYDAVVG